MLTALGSAFAAMLSPENLVFLVAGVVTGMILGAIPGLSAAMAIALVVPFTYYLTPVQSIPMLLAAYNAGTFGGSMAAILIGTPGTPAAGATVADGYSLAKRGMAGKAMKTALFSSVFGCLFSSIVLCSITEPISRYALKFGAPEYTVLLLLALTIIASAAGRSMIKGLIGGMLGMLVGCVGMDQGFAVPRLTFGVLKLSSGVDLIVMMIGILAMSEVFKQMEDIRMKANDAQLPPPKSKEDNQFSRSDLKRSWKHWLRSSLIGCGIGALPGLGPALACYIGYDVGKKFSKHPEEFGNGSVEGIACSEAANNAVCGANMIPLLSLGVPGDTGAALLMGAFMVQGLTPGPLVYMQSPNTVYSIYAGLILSNLMMLVIALFLWRAFRKVCSAPMSIIFPCVCAFCVIGVYAQSASIVDVWTMLFFAIAGYVLTKFKFPMVTMIIGFILAPLFEKNFRRALVLSNGDFGTFFSSPLCIAFWVLTLISVAVILRGKRKDKNLADGL